MADTEHYVYRVIWSPEDEEFVGLCTEFPSLSFLADTRIEAMEGIAAIINEVVEDMAANGEEIPEPIYERKFKGKFETRTTPAIHRQLYITAKEQGISINRLVNEKLACA